MALSSQHIYEGYLRAKKCELSGKVLRYEKISTEGCFDLGKIFVKNDENIVFSVNIFETNNICTFDTIYQVYPKNFSQNLINQSFSGIIDTRNSQILQVPHWEKDLPKVEKCTSSELQVVSEQKFSEENSQNSFYGIFWIFGIAFLMIFIIIFVLIFKKKKGR